MATVVCSESFGKAGMVLRLPQQRFFVPAINILFLELETRFLNRFKG